MVSGIVVYLALEQEWFLSASHIMERGLQPLRSNSHTWKNNHRAYQFKYAVNVLLCYGMVLDEEEACNWNRH
jgi:hypothetical protein